VRGRAQAARRNHAAMGARSRLRCGALPLAALLGPS
jgi:hypothetical protein